MHATGSAYCHEIEVDCVSRCLSSGVDSCHCDAWDHICRLGSGLEEVMQRAVEILTSSASRHGEELT